MHDDDNTLTHQQHWVPFAVGHVQCETCGNAIPVTVMVLIDDAGRAFDHGGKPVVDAGGDDGLVCAQPHPRSHLMSTGNYGTDCRHQHLSQEGNVLHAILDGEPDRALELLRSFLPGEVAALALACTELRGLCTDIWNEKRRQEIAAKTDVPS